ncbi:UDP-3-O-(3-hydroxymyristoyl)glucosamine N-acyltransferase [bacterium LRH843]|nr:UDP-3-O-(3-hydroxymyristoyl)glucosamine N-acyltransferase [bacterium LRH843]
MSFTLFAVAKFLKRKRYIDRFDFSNDLTLEGFSAISNSAEKTVSWMKSQTLDWKRIKSSVIICDKRVELPICSDLIFIKVDNPRLVFAKLMEHFIVNERNTKIENTVEMGENSAIGKNVYIGHYTVIGDNVRIGDNTIIHSHVTLNQNTSIGCDCLIHSGVVIGSDGFGFEKDEDGSYYKFPHIGSVVIKDNVEIGSNTCIDRGVLEDTIVCSNTKIDNLVHIAHGCNIGENCLITAKVNITGSVSIGNNVWIGPNSTISDHVIIEDDAFISLGSVVVKNVSKGEKVTGNFAIPHNDFMKKFVKTWKGN